MQSETLKEHVELLIFFGLIALLLNSFAWRKGLFRLQSSRDTPLDYFRFYHVAAVFGIYLANSFIATPLLTRMFRPAIKRVANLASNYSLAEMGWIQLLSISSAFILLFLFCRTQSHYYMKKIWKDYSNPDVRSVAYDFGLGVICWCVGFPVVAFVGQFCDMFLFWFFGVENYEQVAVRFLKSTMASPFLLSTALITIIIAAPILEEFLFRGFLQNWLKKHIGTKAAILIAALAFALFHFNLSQDLGNISLVLSLFSFACFLGFLYERQGSLFAPIGLHMTFNAISAARILLMT